MMVVVGALHRAVFAAMLVTGNVARNSKRSVGLGKGGVNCQSNEKNGNSRDHHLHNGLRRNWSSKTPADGGRSACLERHGTSRIVLMVSALVGCFLIAEKSIPAATTTMLPAHQVVEFGARILDLSMMTFGTATVPNMPLVIAIGFSLTWRIAD